MSELVNHPGYDHDMPPMDAETPFYNEMLRNQQEAEAIEHANAIEAERAEAEELGIPYMHPDERANLESIARA